MVHIKMLENQEFLGNIAFCSPHAKKLLSVSRRDDFYCLMDQWTDGHPAALTHRKAVGLLAKTAQLANMSENG